MRHRYQPFFDDGEMSVAQAVKIMSTATDRTITSAEAFAAGLIPPTGPKRRWNSSLGQQWRPFPVYTLPLRHDSLLLNFNDDCPMMTSRRKATAELPLAKQLETELQVGGCFSRTQRTSARQSTPQRKCGEIFYMIDWLFALLYPVHERFAEQMRSFAMKHV